jgi:glycosidase
VLAASEPPSWWAGQTVRVLTRDGFSDVAIPPNTKPGPYGPLQVVASLDRKGRFQGFSPDDVMYLIMPDRFANGDPSNDNLPRSPGLLDRTKPRFYHGGDLQGIIDRLPYLKDLGVTVLWLNPVYDNADKPTNHTDYHGYGAVDFYAVDERLGDLHKFRELVDAAHRHGIKVIQDQVANHTGPMHPWVKNPPTPTWFNGTVEQHLNNTWQTWTLMDPNASPALRRATLEGWFVNRLPDLNQNDPEVRRYLIQNTLWWIGMTGIDGIRQDTLPYVPRHFWRDWTAAIKREYPSLRVVGEVLERDPALVAFFQGGRTGFDGIDTGIDTVFDFPLYFAIRRTFAEGKSVREVASVLARDHLYPAASVLVTLLGLHDVERFMNVKGATVDGLKLAYTFLLTTRGTPLIYYGDEIAMHGAGDPDNRRDFPGGWKEDPRNAFEPSGRTPDENAVFNHVRTLTTLRAKTAALRRGKLTQLLAEEQQYVYARTFGRQTAVVAINNASAPSPVVFDSSLRAGSHADRLGTGVRLHVADGQAKIQLQARSAAVFVLD